jgi:stage II sporulation protein D
MSSRAAAVTAAIVASLLVACSSAADRTPPSTPPPAVPTPTASPSAEPTATGEPGGVVGELVRVSPPIGGSFLVRTRFPRIPTRCREPEPTTVTARYPGTLLVRLQDNGRLSLVVALSFDRYLEGIAEVPPSWPPAALDAQAIAARSYALATTGWAGAEGETLERPICATTACQVYRGIPVPPEPTHRRWIRAVRRTDGRVLLHDGRPATTVYFSTSNGRTYPNEDVFGSSPLPYLRPVTEHDDGASPTSRWRVRIPFGDLARSLRAARLWPRGRPITGAHPNAAGALVLDGPGTTRTLDAGDVRDAVNEWTPCLEPRSYPPPIAGGTLPLTIPSRWLAFSTVDGALVVTGRGWGHGVGMVQWGAYGKARQGRSADEILAFYYGGLRPLPHPEPGLIRVQVATGSISLRIVPSGPGAKIDGRALEAGPIVITGGDRLGVRG